MKILLLCVLLLTQINSYSNEDVVFKCNIFNSFAVEQKEKQHEFDVKFRKIVDKIQEYTHPYDMLTSMIDTSFGVDGYEFRKLIAISLLTYIHKQKVIRLRKNDVKVNMRDVDLFLDIVKTELNDYNETRSGDDSEKYNLFPLKHKEMALEMLKIMHKYPRVLDLAKIPNEKKFDSLIYQLGYSKTNNGENYRTKYFNEIKEFDKLLNMDVEVGLNIILAAIFMRDSLDWFLYLWVTKNPLMNISNLTPGKRYSMIKYLSDENNQNLDGYNAENTFTNLKNRLLSMPRDGVLLLTAPKEGSARLVKKLWNSGQRWENEEFLKQANFLLANKKVYMFYEDIILDTDTYASKAGVDWIRKYVMTFGDSQKYFRHIKVALRNRFDNKEIFELLLDLLEHNIQFYLRDLTKLYNNYGGWGNQNFTAYMLKMLDYVNKTMLVNFNELILIDATHEHPNGKKWLQKFYEKVESRKIEDMPYYENFSKDKAFITSDHFYEFYIKQLEIADSQSVNDLKSYCQQ